MHALSSMVKSIVEVQVFRVNMVGLFEELSFRKYMNQKKVVIVKAFQETIVFNDWSSYCEIHQWIIGGLDSNLTGPTISRR